MHFALTQRASPHPIDDDQDKSCPKNREPGKVAALKLLWLVIHADRWAQEPSGKSRVNDSTTTLRAMPRGLYGRKQMEGE